MLGSFVTSTHAATYASRSGVSIEIVSKIILCHSNLSTTQRYLGKVSDTEAMHWIENITGKTGRECFLHTIIIRYLLEVHFFKKLRVSLIYISIFSL